MTRHAPDLVHFHQQRIGVAVVEHLFHFLNVAAFFPALICFDCG